MKCIIVTNIPTPYRNPVWNLLPREDYAVIFCAKKEGNREWVLPDLDCCHFFLRQNYESNDDGYNFVHNNPDIWKELNRLKPKIVITTGINPTHLYAFIWAKLHGARHIYMTDGTEWSEAGIGYFRRFMRRLISLGSSAGVAAGISGKRLLISYGFKADKVHISRLCAGSSNFNQIPFENRTYDVMFCGQFHERKLPYFFIEVCAEIKRRKGCCRVLLIGNGPEREKMLNLLEFYQIDVTYPGFINAEILPNFYSQTKLLLFTTRLDAWGVVANEAMAAGTPVVTTPFAGVANDLVLDWETGRVLDLDVLCWADACLDLLSNPILWNAMSHSALAHVKSFTHASAAKSLIACCNEVLNN